MLLSRSVNFDLFVVISANLGGVRDARNDI